MRSIIVLAVCVGSQALSAPSPKTLPADAVTRLGASVAPSTAGTQPGDINSLVFIDDATLLVAANSGWTSWDLDKRQQRRPAAAGTPTFNLARAGQSVWIGSARKLYLLEPLHSATLEPARSWDSESEQLTALALAPRGQRAVYASGATSLAVLDCTTGKRTGSAEFISRPIAASLTANGRILAVVTRDGAARVYQLSGNGALEPLWHKRVARSERAAAAFSPDGRVFAVASAGRILLLESATGRSIAGVERHFGEGEIRCLAFSADGRQLAAGSAGPDAVVRVWDVDTATEQATRRGHLGDVNAVAFTPNGKMIASAGTDQSVLLWTAPLPLKQAADMALTDSWNTLDALDGKIAYRAVGAFLTDPEAGVRALQIGLRGVADEQASIRRWVRELDHDEFRTREAARRNLQKTGLRGAAALTDPKRAPLGAEGEQRVRLILEALEADGIRIPESGLYGEPLRSVRAVRTLESIGSATAREVLVEAAQGPADLKLTKEAKLALETWPGK